MDIIEQTELLPILRRLNPWWQSSVYQTNLPLRRSVFSQISHLVINSPSKANRAVIISGARRVGKTTLLKQLVESLIRDHKIDPNQILYLTMDYPLLKLAGLEQLLELYENLISKRQDVPTYLLIDELQYINEWQTRLKFFVDHVPKYHIIATGSAFSLRKGGTESGVGRWHLIKVPTLSFYEYLTLIGWPQLQLEVKKYLPVIFSSNGLVIKEIKSHTESLISAFNDYLLKGGFPEIAQISDDNEAQKVLREDVVERVLKRDLTTVFGARNVDDIERLFLYLCINQGCIINRRTVAEKLGISTTSLVNYISYLEDANLLYTLSPYKLGGKKALKKRNKYYLADSSLANAVFLRGKELFEDNTALGMTVETTVFKHIFTQYYKNTPLFGYWYDATSKKEVDIIVNLPDEGLFPFEVKYRQSLRSSDIEGILRFVEEEEPLRSYIITKDIDDFELFHYPKNNAPILRIPAAIFCYLLGLAEIESD
ncbi:ATP-binding protein [bacterium]|nr:ATP-binding protein [bacterium]MBU1651173.1 ATP-binding protein [bacterium]MBU1880684.1 ATP-binding protein [bacterium]